MCSSDLDVERTQRDLLGHHLGAFVDHRGHVAAHDLFIGEAARRDAGAPAFGVIDQPVLRERWCGGKGLGTTLNGAPQRVSSTAALARAILYATTPYMFQGEDRAHFERLAAAVKHPLFGADCYAYGLVASGFADLVCEADLKPYDYFAPAAVIEGAGGTVTD